MVFVGFQFLIWSITGVYMVSMDIHFIHGETLQRTEKSKVELNTISYSITELITTFPSADKITLVNRLERPIYQFRVSIPIKKWLVVDAKTGELLPDINQTQAVNIAKNSYSQLDKVSNVRLISDKNELPSELSSRHLPVWQVTFEHYSSPTFYISQQSGSIVTKRHDFWRVFDWMWRFHIMDYDDGKNVANWFLLLVALLGSLAAVSGAILTYFRVIKSQIKGLM
jgi:hypothetical protein